MNKLNFNELSIVINILINFQNDPLKASDRDIKILKDYFYYKFADIFINCFPHKEYSFKRKDLMIGAFGKNTRNYKNNYLYFYSKCDPCTTIAIKYDIYTEQIIDKKIYYDSTKCKYKIVQFNLFKCVQI